MNDLNDMLQKDGSGAVRDYLDASATKRDGCESGPTPQKYRGNWDWRDHTITAAALKQMNFPPVSFVVPGLIPDGLSILAGRPKVGKSWLALEFGMAVATGRPCLGDSGPTQGDVLYLALEDNCRRLSRRIDKLELSFGRADLERLILTTSWRRLDKGGLDDIKAWASGVTKPRLVLIDTLAGARPIRIQNGYNEDYEALSALHRFANECAIAVVVCHHTRKMDADDPIDTVSGTHGLTGCADTTLVLTRSSQGMKLYVRGRDIEEAEHAVSFDKTTCRWSILGEASDVHRSGERNRILSTFRQSDKKILGPQEIADSAQMPSANVRKLLGKMVAAGELEKFGHGRYALTEDH